jgi:TRAP-type C4-dicarboxylate transport system permease small subunit
MKYFEKVVNALCVAGAVLGGVAMFAMMVQVGLDVTLKYLFNQPVKHTLEMVSSYYMVALVFLPLGLVTRDKGHVIVELFTAGFSKPTIALIDALGSVLALAYVSTMAVKSFETAAKKTAIRESWEAATLDIQVWPARWFLPIGCTLMALYLIVHIWNNLDHYRTKTDPESMKGASGL